MMKPRCACNAPRRGFLGAALGLAGGSLLNACSAPTLDTAASAAVSAPRIDAHHHFFSPTYVAELERVNQAAPIVKNWSVGETLEDMSRAGVGTAMLSVTTPQAFLTNSVFCPSVSVIPMILPAGS